MQTTTLVVSVLSLAVSTTTLVVIVLGAKRAQSLVLDAQVTAQQKIDGLKRAVAEL